MFAKRLLQKATHLHHRNQYNLEGCLTQLDVEFQAVVHYGIPSTASILAFDPTQHLLATGTLDGRIKVIGGDNIEGLLISPDQLPNKFLEFLPNQGFLVNISNDNNIQVWSLETRSVACSLQWESNITAFSVICSSQFMLVGDEHGFMSVLKHDVENLKLLLLPYHLSSSSLSDAAGLSFSNHQPIVGVLPQPCSSGNRVLVAYENGLIVLWDFAEGRVVVVKGDKVLELKHKVDGSPTEVAGTSEQYMEDREISALCWASSNGSILAVGYVDGDILFWRTATFGSKKGKKSDLSSDNVVKLQLSSAERRLPVIVLHWSGESKSRHDGDGQLFIYGGDAIGSDEVITVLTLEWQPGMETLRCIGRADIMLAGSFADMILLPSVPKNLTTQSADLFILTSPGRLQFLGHESLSALASQHDKRLTVSSVDCPVVIPTVDPIMTLSKLFSLQHGVNSARSLSEIVTNTTHGTRSNLVGGNWPLIGGVAKPLSSRENTRIERIYVAGYINGSVQIWDATSPVLSIISVLDGKVEGLELTSSSASVSALDFCSQNLSLAVGTELGHVRIYGLDSSSKETSFHLVIESKHEVQKLAHGGPNCKAVFCLVNSPVQALLYDKSGTKLAVGYECGRVALLDMNLFSILFLTQGLSSPCSSVIFISGKPFVRHEERPKQSEPRGPDNPAEALVLTLTKDGEVHAINTVSGKMIHCGPMHSKKEDTVISMHVIDGSGLELELSNEKNSQQSTPNGAVLNVVDEYNTEHDSFVENAHSGSRTKESIILLCWKDALRLYRLKSLLQGNGKSIHKVKLTELCCCTSIFKKSDRVCGLVLLYQTGEIEVRSLPGLEFVKKTSLMSILGWNFKAYMERTMSSTDYGQIALVNGCEVAIISLLSGRNDFGIPESLPCLFDKVLAAATEAAISCSSNRKKKQGTSGVLDNIFKGFKGEKVDGTIDLSSSSISTFSHLENIFSENPFPGVSETRTGIQEDDELNIDDIEIEEPVLVAFTSSHVQCNDEKEKRSERERLFDSVGADAVPRLRTREEIIATYRKPVDASLVAGQARNKLLERQEKLEKISKRTEDLHSGAEDFASLANELVKEMERRKWWQI